MVQIDELLSKLNEEQIKPVLDTEGAVLVIAGAGSGKTRVLTTRIAYLVLEKGVKPENILAITFTNKATLEMQNRLSNFIGDTNIWVSTIHSMCTKILRSNIDKIGYNRDFTIYDDTDKEKVLKRVMESLGYEKDNKLFKPIKNLISTAKNDCLYPDELSIAYKTLNFIDDAYKVYKAYEEELSKSNSLDFDDLLFKTYELFNRCPEVADYYSEKFHYIHVDEFQDTNKVQFAIINRLSYKHANLFVVGDDDQSIYGWRGAKIDNILRFDAIYTGAKVYKLERNYRSTKKILELANTIIKNNVNRRDKELWTENGEGAKIETFVSSDEIEEAKYITLQIKSLMDRDKNLNYSDFAVFMRVNAISRAFEQEFNNYGIPYRVYGGFRFFERREIKDILAYLKVIVNPFDDESFIRCISSPKRGIGDKTLKDLREFAVANSTSMLNAISLLDLSSISGGAKTKLITFANLLKEFTEYSKNNFVGKTIQYIIDTTSFKDQFDGDEEEKDSKLMNINELVNSAIQFEKVNGSVTLADYLNSVTLSSDTDEILEGNVVTIATIHSAKGLEFPIVFVAGLDEGILPVKRNTDNDFDLEEERRLMYVAVTRAMNRLYLTRATSRYMYGNREIMIVSRFLKEGYSVLGIENRVERDTSFKKDTYQNERRFAIYNDGDDTDCSSSLGGYSSSYAKTFLTQVTPKENKNVVGSSYKSGVKVKHAKFGVGTIILVKGSGDNIVVDVAFPTVGIKSLAVKFAPMEIING